jgi:hypothetical protein
MASHDLMQTVHVTIFGCGPRKAKPSRDYLFASQIEDRKTQFHFYDRSVVFLRANDPTAFSLFLFRLLSRPVSFPFPSTPTTSRANPADAAENFILKYSAARPLPLFQAMPKQSSRRF